VALKENMDVFKKALEEKDIEIVVSYYFLVLIVKLKTSVH